jgi:STE24 endopeptidase
MRTICTLSLLCCLLPLLSAASQSATSTQASPSVQSTPAPAPSGPATAYTLPPDKLAKSRALYILGGKLLIFSSVYSFVLLLALLHFEIVAKYRAWTEKASSKRFVQALIVVPLLLLTIDVLHVPFRIYGHHIGLQYGLSVQGWGPWLVDVLKGEALSLFLGTLVLYGLVSIIRRSPKRWWLYFWLASIPFGLFFTFISPMVIDPMFNKFEPLEAKNPQLVQALEKVVQRGGLVIPRDRMYEMKASEKLTVLNAYVTGIGASKRVVIWDTTIQKLTTPETLSVFGHEMGHYVLHHVAYGLAMGFAGLLLALYVAYRICGWLLPRVQQRWHIRELGDWAALPMMFLLFGVLSFVAQPIDATISRQIEHNADIYGLEVTHGLNADSQQAAVHAFQVLGETSLEYPYPSRWVVFWFYDHPPTADRVRFAHEYDPWSKGEPPEYVK